MKIHGLNKTTLLDYPGRVAATIFTGSCNFRCPFCHNASLVLHPNTQPVFSEEEVLSFLNKRKAVLTGVCITGGEPTLQPDLADFLSRIKALGYSIKLDTNGYQPDILNALLDQRLIDYVAMDVKACLADYPKVAGIPQFEPERITTSLQLLKNSNISYELRTTIVPSLHSLESLKALAEEIKDCTAYYLQPFQDSGDILNGSFSEFTKDELQLILSEIQKIIPSTQLRSDI